MPMTLPRGNDTALDVAGLRSIEDDGTPNPILDAVLKATICRTTRTGKITAIADGPPMVATSNAHGLQEGAQVVIVGAEAEELPDDELFSANDVFTVGAVTANTFELDGSAANGDYTGQGDWWEVIPGGAQIPISFVADSEGNYQGILRGTLPLRPNERYLVFLFPDNPLRSHVQWELEATGSIRRS